LDVDVDTLWIDENFPSALMVSQMVGVKTGTMIDWMIDGLVGAMVRMFPTVNTLEKMRVDGTRNLTRPTAR